MRNEYRINSRQKKVMKIEHQLLSKALPATNSSSKENLERDI